MNAKDKYRELRSEVDKLSDKLSNQHKSNLNCKKGCDSCCMEFSVLPVEFFTIVDEMKNRELSINHQANDEQCMFLVGHECQIYPSRPFICRTHGLPLLYMNDEGTAWELSFCELNFTDFELADFEDTNTFPQDKFNSQMYLLNKAFLEENKELPYGKRDLIPVRELLKYVNAKH